MVHVASVAALNWWQLSHVHWSLFHSQKRRVRRLFTSSLLVGPLFRLLAITVLYSRRCSLGTLKHRCKDTIHTKIVHYTAWDGLLHPMVAHPKEVTHHINKVSYNIQKWQRPDPIPSEYHNSPANALNYRSVLIGRPGTSDTHIFSGVYHNWML